MRRPRKKIVMKGFVQNLEGLAVDNVDFRRVLYTAKHCQLVLMALEPKEEIGAEASRCWYRPGRSTTSSTPARRR